MDKFDAFIKSMDAWKENVALQIATIHSAPSQLTLEKFKNIDDRFDSVDKKLDMIVNVIGKNSDKIRALEDWKLAFTAKLSAYVGIAVFLGSIIGSVLTTFITRFI